MRSYNSVEGAFQRLIIAFTTMYDCDRNIYRIKYIYLRAIYDINVNISLMITRYTGNSFFNFAMYHRERIIQNVKLQKNQ